MALLERKVVVVSGVGPGLGRSVALACARQGADVVLAARTQERLDAVAAEVESLGRRALVLPTDLVLAADCESLVSRTVETFGQIDALVNNAFVMPAFGELAEYDVEKIQSSFDVNLYAPLRLSQAAIPHMRRRGGGAIVMINSVVLRKQPTLYGPYKMAKHALLGLARSLAAEVGPDGIRVNTVAPGYIGAGVVDLVAQIEAARSNGSVDEARQAILDTLMLRRAPEPDEIADAVVFFASEMSRSITGQCLDVTSGEFAH